MIGAGWTALFGVLQALDPVYEIVTGEKGQVVQFPVWPIGADEAKKLGEATAGQLATLPAARRKSMAKFINEYAPTFVLAAAIYEVGSPRLKYSMKAKADLRGRTMEAQRAAYARTTGNGHPSNGAAQAPNGADYGVSAGARSSAHHPGEAAAANANRNGAADAFTADPGLG